MSNIRVRFTKIVQVLHDPDPAANQPHAWMHFEIQPASENEARYFGRARGDIRSPFSPDTANIVLPRDLPPGVDRVLLEHACEECRREAVGASFSLGEPGVMQRGMLVGDEQEIQIDRAFSL